MATKKKNRIYMLKWTHNDGRCNGGSKPYQYSLPKGAILGSWHVIPSGHVGACQSGFHGSSLQNIHDYTGYGSRLWLVEVDGKYDTERNKVAVEKARFVKEIKLDASLMTFRTRDCDIKNGCVTKFRECVKSQLPAGTIKGISAYCSGDFNEPKHVKHFRFV